MSDKNKNDVSITELDESEFEKITIDYNSVYPQGTKKARSLYYRECIFKDGKLIIEGK